MQPLTIAAGTQIVLAVCATFGTAALLIRWYRKQILDDAATGTQIRDLAIELRSYVKTDEAAHSALGAQIAEMSRVQATTVERALEGINRQMQLIQDVDSIKQDISTRLAEEFRQQREWMTREVSELHHEVQELKVDVDGIKVELGNTSVRLDNLAAQITEILGRDHNGRTDD